jgi:hypothetical protein
VCGLDSYDQYSTGQNKKLPVISIFTLNCKQPSVECGWRLLGDELESMEEVADLEGLLKYLSEDGSHNSTSQGSRSAGREADYCLPFRDEANVDSSLQGTRKMNPITGL